MIGRIGALQIVGVKLAKSLSDCLDAFAFQKSIGLAAHGLADRRQFIDATGHGVDIHHRPPAHNRIFSLLPNLGEQSHDIRLKLRCRIVGVKRKRRHEVMTHPGELFGRWGGCADREALIDLARIGGDNVTMKPDRQLQCKVGLA